MRCNMLRWMLWEHTNDSRFGIAGRLLTKQPFVFFGALQWKTGIA